MWIPPHFFKKTLFKMPQGSCFFFAASLRQTTKERAYSWNHSSLSMISGFSLVQPEGHSAPSLPSWTASVGGQERKAEERMGLTTS